MGSLLFFVRTMVFTLVVVVLLQIKVGQSTLEEQTLHWVYTSELTVPLREAAEGGATIIRDIWNKVAGSLNTEFSRAINSKNRPGERSIGINLKRSKEYIKEKSEQAAQKIKDELEGEGILEELEE